MIKFLLNRRYNLLDLMANMYMYGLWVKTGEWYVFLLTIPFSILIALLESFERTRDGGKK